MVSVDKHGIDARLLQVRNAQISLTALVSGEVPIFLPSIANVLSGITAGAKLGCIACPEVIDLLKTFCEGSLPGR